MKTYIIAYTLAGDDYTTRIEAESWDDAERRLKAIAAAGRIVGEWDMDMPEKAEPVAYLWQHGETGRTRIVMPDQIITIDAGWQIVGPLYLGSAPQPQPKQEPVAWQPIETAPKAGQWVLVWRPHYTVPLIAKWDSNYVHRYGLTHWMPLPPVPDATSPQPQPKQEPVSIKAVAAKHGINIPKQYIPTMDDVIAAGDGVLMDEQAALLRECRAALDSLIEQKPTLAGLLCGSTTLGNLKASLHDYRPQGVFGGTTPQPQREWFSLTDEDIPLPEPALWGHGDRVYTLAEAMKAGLHMDAEGIFSSQQMIELAHAIEAKLREKNGGGK